MNTTVRLLPLAVALLTLTGCVTRGYTLADQNIPPAVPLNLTNSPALPSTPAANAGATTTTTPPPAAATLRTVIVYKGPGSWKKEAYWDEYVVSLANRGDSPLVVSDATLAGALGDPVTPGDDPWKLDRLGKSWWQTNAADSAKTYLLLGTGTVVGGGVALAGALSGGILGTATSAGATAIGVGSAVVVALPLVAIGTVGMNIHRKHQIQDEFTRRRLALPITLAPGQVVEGSLFFRITPAPQKLTLDCRAGSESHPLVIDLAPLANLHLAPPVAAPSARTHLTASGRP